MKFVYAVEQVLDKWVNRSQRQAVLRPELGLHAPPLHRIPAPGMVQREMKKLRKLWRARLQEFADLGWERLKNKQNFLYTANCAPFGMKLRQLTAQERTEQPGVIVPTRYCRQRKFCPFCWARTLEECFDRFHFALYGTVKTGRETDPETGKKRYSPPRRGDLLELHYFHLFDAIEGHDKVDQLCKKLSRWRPDIARRFNPWGGVVLYTIEPTDESRYWRIHTRVLLLTSCGQAYRSQLGAKVGGERPTLIRHVPYKNHGKVTLTRLALAEAIARTWVYPWRLLDPSADPMIVSHLVNQLYSFRSFSYCGTLRNKSERLRTGKTRGID